MRDDKTSYNHAFLATGIFGFIQVSQILITLIKGKFIALLLGASGIGINSLYFSALAIVIQISGLGLAFSAMRNISQAVESNDDLKLRVIVTVFKKWLLLSAIFGGLIVILFAPYISNLTFGDKSHTLSFRLLSLATICSTLNNGNNALLQGTMKIKYIAIASFLSSMFGLVTAVPLYYFFGVKGILPALIITPLMAMLTSNYFVNKLKIKPIQVSYNETYTKGKEMIMMGITMMFASLIGLTGFYGINAFIRHFGNIADVGLYQAGMSLTNASVGAIFTALASDYFPRLASVSDDRKKVTAMANQQAEIITLIAAPLLLFLILASPILVPLLLSHEFVYLIDFVKITAFGMLFKAASFPFGYISFAKGDKKTFFVMEGVLGSLMIFFGNISGYKIGGIMGMAISFVVIYIIYFVIVNIVIKKLYGFSLKREFLRIFIITIAFISSSIVVCYLTHGLIFSISISILIIGLFIFTIKELNKRIELREIFNNFILKIKVLFHF